jgi:outer membrane receptor protein involved in Fe transport
MFSDLFTKTLFWVGAMLLATMPANGSPDTAGVTELDRMVVTASRTLTLAKNSSQSVSVITAADLMASPYDNVEDIVRATPGLHNFRHSALHQNGIVSPLDMRGAGKGRVLFLVDGVPQNDNFNNAIAWVGWGHIPKSAIERIEIVRGPTSALYGSEGLGGVINIITKRPNEGRTTGIQAKAGNATTLNAGGWHYQKIQNFGFMAAGGYEQTDGFYLVEDPADYEIERYRKKGQLFGSLLYDFSPQSRLEVSALYFKQDAGQGREHFHNDLQLDQYALHYAHSFDNITFQGLGYLNRSNKTAFQDNAADNYTSLNREEKFKGTYNAGADIQGTVVRWEPVSIVVGGAYKFAHFEYDVDYAASQRDAGAQGDQQTISPFCLLDVSVLNERLLFNLGVRYDRILTSGGRNWDTQASAGKPAYDSAYGDTKAGSISPKAGITWRPDQKSAVRASVGKGFRAPSLFELYKVHVRGGGTYYRNASPDLEPESILSWDIGAERTFVKKLLLKATFYQSFARDYIGDRLTGTYPFSGGTKTRYEYILDNISEVNIHGVEFETHYSPFDFLTISGNYTYNTSKVGKDLENESLEGNYLPNNPRHSGHACVNYHDPKIINAALMLNAYATIFFDNENTLKKDNYYTLDASVSRQFFGMLTVFLNVENMLNNKYPIFMSPSSGNTIAPGVILNGGARFDF